MARGRKHFIDDASCSCIYWAGCVRAHRLRVRLQHTVTNQAIDTRKPAALMLHLHLAETKLQASALRARGCQLFRLDPAAYEANTINEAGSAEVTLASG